MSRGLCNPGSAHVAAGHGNPPTPGPACGAEGESLVRDSVLEGICGGGAGGRGVGPRRQRGVSISRARAVGLQKCKFKPFLKEELGFQDPWEVAQLPFWSPGDTTLASETGSEIARGIPWSPRGSWGGFSSSFGVILAWKSVRKVANWETIRGLI